LLFDPSDFLISSGLCPELAQRFRVCRKPWKSRTWPQNRSGPAIVDWPLLWKTPPHKSLAEILNGKRRERTCESRYRYVRRVKCGWQARIPIGPTPADSINLGLFTDTSHGGSEAAEWAAGRAATWFSRLRTAGKTCWQVICELKARGYVPEGVLPRWVYRRADGMYAAKRRAVKSAAIDLPGPFASPEEAFAAMRERVTAVLRVRVVA
jgi:hypothetical protein